VVDIPDRLVLERNRDLQGVRRRPWPRWFVLGLITLFAVFGLLNVFGQRPTTARATAAAASLDVYAPTHLRGGLLFSARFHITAHRELKRATLVLDPGWAEGMSINTIEPGPIGEASANGRLSLALGHIPAGGTYILFMQFQVNATNVAWHRPQDVVLQDGTTPILHIHRRVNVYP
jgi:hypothetical protein